MDHREASKIFSDLTRAGTPTPASARVSTDYARLLLSTCLQTGFTEELPVFLLLCRLATARIPELASAATNAIYREVVEPLCDDFSRQGSEQSHLLLAALIAFLAESGQEPGLAGTLSESGLGAAGAMLGHWHRAVSPAAFPGKDFLRHMEKVVIPSRVTAGADVAITSVLLGRLRQALPDTEIVLVGPAHLPQLFSDLAGVRHLFFGMPRQGDLAERFRYWPALLATVREELSGTNPGRGLVLDPDSRLTQLGLLPMANGVGVCQFPSQTMAEDDDRLSLSELCNRWLDQLLGKDDPAYPFISPAPTARQAAATFCGRLRGHGARRLVLVNLGVGGNDCKKLPPEFEHLLLNRLLEQEKTIIILDTGCGSEEKSRAGKLLARVRGAGPVDLNRHPPALFPTDHGVIGINASLGELAATCLEVDAYFGYDSCGQHLANGAGTPRITFFRGHPNRRFLGRWSPWNRRKNCAIIPVAHGDLTGNQLTDIIDRGLRALKNSTAPRLF